MNIQTVSGKVFATNNEQKSPVFLSMEALHEWLDTPQGKEFQGEEIGEKETPVPTGERYDSVESLIQEKPKKVAHKKKKG